MFQALDFSEGDSPGSTLLLHSPLIQLGSLGSTVRAPATHFCHISSYSIASHVDICNYVYA